MALLGPGINRSYSDRFPGTQAVPEAGYRSDTFAKERTQFDSKGS